MIKKVFGWRKEKIWGGERRRKRHSRRQRGQHGPSPNSIHLHVSGVADWSLSHLFLDLESTHGILPFVPPSWSQALELQQNQPSFMAFRLSSIPYSQSENDARTVLWTCDGVQDQGTQIHCHDPIPSLLVVRTQHTRRPGAFMSASVV
ncbi:hypothetical protein PM082_011241 [Marasmius tenuissimus]|nr:hypothetical protein PM082_011241 [Marasmius tenuissimus]